MAAHDDPRPAACNQRDVGLELLLRPCRRDIGKVFVAVVMSAPFPREMLQGVEPKALRKVQLGSSRVDVGAEIKEYEDRTERQIKILS